jgi:hypothetical protein
MTAELGRASPFSSVVAANGHGISDDFGSSVERHGGSHPVHAGREDAYGVRCRMCWVERVAGCSGRCVKLPGSWCWVEGGRQVSVVSYADL